MPIANSTCIHTHNYTHLVSDLRALPRIWYTRALYVRLITCTQTPINCRPTVNQPTLNLKSIINKHHSPLHTPTTPVGIPVAHPYPHVIFARVIIHARCVTPYHVCSNTYRLPTQSFGTLTPTFKCSSTTRLFDTIPNRTLPSRRPTCLAFAMHAHCIIIRKLCRV